MKEWFKARNVWGATIRSLSDAEAGRIAKAIWTYTMDGEIMPLEGAEKGIFPMILMTLDQDESREADISAKRAAVGSLGGKQRAANATNSKQLLPIATNCKQVQPNDSNCFNKNQNQNQKQNIESESEFIADDSAAKIMTEQNRVLDAAEDAGFLKSNSVRARLIDLYSVHGLDKMLAAIDACVHHGVINLAYLEAVLKGESKKSIRAVPALNYEQRDYTGVQDEAVRQMMAWNPEVDEA